LRREISDLYENHGAALLRYARAVATSGELARDAVQEAFLRYHARRTSGAVIQSPRAWLYKVVFNFLMDGAEPNVPLEEASTAPDPAFGRQEHAEAASLENTFARILSPRELACVRYRWGSAVSRGLQFEQLGVAALHRYELFVRTFFQYPAMFEHENPVRHANR
jgi:DNA-directed RNA polymerase specialized sigma24 family protein